MITSYAQNHLEASFEIFSNLWHLRVLFQYKGIVIVFDALKFLHG